MFFLWLQQNWGNILVIAALAVLVTVLVLSLIASKRKSKSSGGGCCGGCAGCAMQGKCHTESAHSDQP